MTSPVFSTPRQALDLMLKSGAAFTVRDRTDALGPTFTYRVGEGGDLAECRRVLVAAKAKPRQFWAAFEMLVAQVADRRPS